MFHVRRSQAGALAVSAIVCSTLVFTLIGTAYWKRTPAAAPATLSISAVEGKTAKLKRLAPELSWREQASGKIHHLSELRGRPVILCLGSYTCGPFRTSLNLINQVYRKNRGQIACLLVYTKEAHPELGPAAYMSKSQTCEDRKAAAGDLSKEANLTMPVVVDTLDNRATTAFAARPSRIYVLDRKGSIVFASSAYPTSDMAVGAVAAVKRMTAAKYVQ